MGLLLNHRRQVMASLDMHHRESMVLRASINNPSKEGTMGNNNKDIVSKNLTVLKVHRSQAKNTLIRCQLAIHLGLMMVTILKDSMVNSLLQDSIRASKANKAHMAAVNIDS